jgi:hypothetical protein
MSKINLFVSGGIALLGAAAWFQPAVAGSDLWWHLASGRDIWAQGAVPQGDPYSHTMTGAIWMNHEWLWDVVYWRAYSLHPELPAWLNLGVVLTASGLAFWVALRTSGSALAAGAALWLAAAASHWFIDIRPHLFSLLFVGLFLRTREWRYAPWLWPPLVVIWANTHAGFVFGIGTIGLYVLGRTLASLLALRADEERAASGLRDWLQSAIPWPEWISLTACLLATLANPWGIHIIEYPLAYLDSSSPFRGIIEWLPPAFSLDLTRFEGRFWWLAAITLASAAPAWRRSPYLVALTAVTLAMAWTSRRFIPLFGITAAPIIATGLAAALALLRERVPALDARAARITTTAVALATAALLWSDVRIYPNLLSRWTQAHFYPSAAVRYLEAIDPPRRLFNLYNWGGFLMLHAPELRVFIDGRANTIYSARVYEDYQRLAAGVEGHRALLARYGVDMVMMPTQYALSQRLMQGASPWQPVYQDRSTVLLVPPDSPYLSQPLPDPDEIVGEYPERVAYRARLEVLRGRADVARRMLEDVLEQHPLHLPIYSELAAAWATMGDIGAMSRTIERGRRACPREGPQLSEAESFFLTRFGELDRAIEALREAEPKGPFRNPERIQRRIEELEKARSRPTGGAAQSG